MTLFICAKRSATLSRRSSPNNYEWPLILSTQRLKLRYRTLLAEQYICAKRSKTFSPRSLPKNSGWPLILSTQRLKLLYKTLLAEQYICAKRSKTFSPKCEPSNFGWPLLLFVAVRKSKSKIQNPTKKSKNWKCQAKKINSQLKEFYEFTCDLKFCWFLLV